MYSIMLIAWLIAVPFLFFVGFQVMDNHILFLGWTCGMVLYLFCPTSISTAIENKRVNDNL